MKEKELKKKLTKEQHEVLRRGGTEKPFTGKYLYNKESGMYVCAACGQPLFSSKTKFDSGSGWPSFYKPAKEGSIKKKKDFKLGIPRTEILCGKCGSHLGHVFDDAPQTPTGKRYCLNSVALDFKKKPKKVGSKS